MAQDPPYSHSQQRGPDSFQVSKYFTGNKRYFHAKMGINVIKVFGGDCYVSDHKDEMMATILGSCVSACIRDTDLNLGGMNHFLLPVDEHASGNISEAARYGVFAMENLINKIIKAGGHKDRLEIKVFGGGNVIQNSTPIGSLNSKFIRKFLHDGGYHIAAEDLEGNRPRSVHYYPATGKVMIRYLHRKEDMVIVDEETRYLIKTFKAHIKGDSKQV